MEQTYRIIRSPHELAALSVMPLMQPRPRRPIRLATETITEEQRATWERQLNRAYGACGCGEASLGTLTGLLIAGGGLAIVGAGSPGFGWADAGVLVAGVAVGTALGKFMGLGRAQAKLRRLVREIRTQWEAPRPTYTEGCG
ncbi:MAG: hypothetical protein QOD74_718 [Variibacter sp.]|jgi:hypothetical protein|nr:hypothetical protein [Variibacter sp.]